MRIFVDYGTNLREFMENIQFTDIRFTSTESEEKGSAILKIKDKKYYFEFFLYDLEIIEEMTDQKTNKVFNFEQMLERTLTELPKDKIKTEVNKFLKDGMFNNQLSIRFGQALVSLVVEKFKEEVNVEFKNFKNHGYYIGFSCDFEIFNKHFEMELLGGNLLIILESEKIDSYPFYLKDSKEGEINSYNQWFMEEVNKRSEDNVYYRDKQIQVFHDVYNAKNIIGYILIQKLKENKEYRMLGLYEPVFKIDL